MTEDRAYGDAMLTGLLYVAGEFTAVGLNRLDEPARSLGAMLRRLVLVQCNPLYARLFIVEGDDIHEIWRAGGTDLPEAMGDTVGGFVATGLRMMKPEDAKSMLRMVDAEEADIFVIVEPHAGLAKALVIRPSWLVTWSGAFPSVPKNRWSVRE